VTVSGQALELNGWRDAWRHELRGPHGEWVSSGDGEKWPGEHIHWVVQYWKNESDPKAKQELNLAGASYNTDDPLGAAEHLRRATVTAANLANQDKYEKLAASIESGAMSKDPVGSLMKRLDSIRYVEPLDPYAPNYANLTADLTYAYRHLEAAQNSTDEGNVAGQLSTAARRIGQAANLADDGSDLNTELEHLEHLTTQLSPKTALGTSSGLRTQMQSFVKKGADVVPKMLGADHESWNGNVDIRPEIGGSPYVLGELDWNRKMSLREDLAKRIQTSLDLTGEPISNPEDFTVPLHELIHGAVEDTNSSNLDQAEYQDPAIATIEEGFTELGTIHHAPEYFDAMGIGDRQTQRLSDIDGNPVPNPDWENQRQKLHTALRDEAARVRAEGKYGVVSQQAARHVDDAADDIDNGNVNGAIDELSQLQHLGDSTSAENALKLRAQILKFGDTPQSKHATMTEYAQRLQDPARISDGDVWGHYPNQTRAAQEWVQQVAMAEAGDRPFDASKPGSPDWKRVVELSDEINRQGTAGKKYVMAKQVARLSSVKTAGGGPVVSDADMRNLEESIVGGFSDLVNPSGKDAFRKAMATMHKQGLVMSGISDQVLDLGWRFNPLEPRDAHGEWTRGGAGYEIPGHNRLINPRGRPPDPADHSFFKAHPVSADNVVKTYSNATDAEKAQGMRWYADAHALAKVIGQGDAVKGAGMLASYSPQTPWPINMFNAARAIELGRALGPGDGMITRTMQAHADNSLHGMSTDDNFGHGAPKIRAFAHLIEDGGDKPEDTEGQVVIDRHAMSVAIGQRLTKELADQAPISNDRGYQYVADAYREAARRITAGGTPISPHQLQAITWLHQQAANAAEDEAAGAKGAGMDKGRQKMIGNAWRKWGLYAKQHGEPVEHGTTALTGISDQVLELGWTGWMHEPRDAHGRWTRVERVAEPITAAEARGDSRPVSHDEFQRLATQGRDQLRVMKRNASPITGLDRNWAAVKEKTYAQVQDSWGGATIDSHTGHALPDGADAYALTVKPQGMGTVSVPEHASRADFEDAMDRALAQFRSELEQQDHYLGIFHDDDNHRIDIDPVVVVNNLHSVETIGAYTHAIGGAYHFKSGDGFWPPHVAEVKQMSNPTTPHWAGPGQWRSAAAAIQPGLSPNQQADIASDDDDAGNSGDDDPPLNWAGISDQVLELGWDGWRTELRDSHGRWTRSPQAVAAQGSLAARIGHRTVSFLKTGSMEEIAQPASPEIHAFTAKAAAAMPGMLGGGTQGFSGKVRTLPKLQFPTTLAQMEWNGDMTLRSDVAATLQEALTSDKPVDPGPVEVIEHELIHGVTATQSYGGEYNENKDAYQELSVTMIEEGFTELGAIQHAGDFFRAMGIGGHGTPDSQHPTFESFARNAAQPKQIVDGNSWGHYSPQVSGAYGWAQQIAEMEGAADKDARIIELSDEINQRGAAGKVDVMAAQVLSAAAKNTPGGWGGIKVTPDLLDAVRTSVKQGFEQGGGELAVSLSTKVAKDRLAALAAERS
jgi:hypothetical protein